MSGATIESVHTQQERGLRRERFVVLTKEAAGWEIFCCVTAKVTSFRLVCL